MKIAARRKRTPGHLNGKGYYYAFLAGAKKILENQKELNRINVFPVPDADTGSNLASTVSSIIERVRPRLSYQETSTAIAAAALEGARGNSGIIFAQFLNGLGTDSRGCHEISLARFAQSVRQAVRYMYEAIAEPKEGTMITVIRRWAESLASPKDEPRSFLKLMAQAYGQAVEALQETRFRLEPMKKANVVDAGSKGMVLFLEGVMDFLAKPSHKKILSVRQNVTDIERVVETFDGPVGRRYCTEALIKPRPGTGASGLDTDALKRAVEGFGDSLVIAGSPDVLRMHIHTDTPAELFFSIRDFGDFVQGKADDMLRQHEAAHARRRPIALVTDSCCDLPAALLDRYQIHMVPIQLSFGDSVYLDKATIAPDQFYRMLDERKEFPKSAQPNVRAFETLYERLAAHYDSIIAVHLSQKLSGTYSSSAKAAGTVSRATGKPITVVDSRNLSGSLGLLVLRLACLIEAGHSHEEIAAEAESLVPKAKILVAVRTLKYMVRGGRVSPMAGAAAKVLNLKPIVSMGEDGESTIFGKAFSQRGTLKAILGQASAFKARGRVRDYCVLHAHNPEGALDYAAKMEGVLGRPPAYTMDISPVIGLNAGVGAVAVSFLLES
jgi:uncharacterized protein